MSGTRLTLVIPELFPEFCALAERVRLPSLEALLARSREERTSPRDFGETICALFGCPSGGDLPIGALRRLGDGGVPDEGWWYCAEPVHYFADRDSLRLVLPGELAIGMDEARELVRTFNGHFAGQGWYLEAPQPDRWYLRAPESQSVRTHAPGRAMQSLRHTLPQGPGALRWNAFLNETQMLFHGDRVNVAREAAGRPAINGLWPWGGGALPSLGRVFGEVWSGDPLVRGAALASGAIAHDLPSRPPAIEPGTEGLMVMDPPGGAAEWKRWDEVWWSPMRDLVRTGRIDELLILDGAGHVFSSTRSAHRRWWRRSRSLRDYSS